MRVRPHIGLLPQTLTQVHGAQMVEEYERADHVTMHVGQDTAHLEAAEAPSPWLYHDRAHAPPPAVTVIF
jgi:hypothetical protein